MKVKENNLYFIAAIFFLAVVLGGLSIVDSGLNRLIMPEEPFISVAVQYNHGLELKVPGKQVSVPCIELCSVNTKDNYWHIARGGASFMLPRYISFGDIDKLRSWLNVDKMTP